MNAVLVMNASYEALHTVSLKHAIKMLVREVAVVHEAVSDTDFVGHLPRPKAVRLVRYIFPRWLADDAPRAFSKAAVHKRDGHTCLYCGARGTTIDHVLPRSRGGATSWENCCSCCEDCNSEKDNKTPEEAGMRLRYQPFDPAKRASRRGR